MTDDDPNADLVGYEYVNHTAGGSRWRVTGTDPVLKRSYVRLARVLDGGRLGTHAHDVRVQTAESVRRRRELDPTGDRERVDVRYMNPPCAPHTVAKGRKPVDVDREYAPAPVTVDEPQLSLEVA